MFVELMNYGVKNPAIVICDSSDTTTDQSLIHYAIETGGLLLDGLSDGVCLGHYFGNRKEHRYLLLRKYEEIQKNTKPNDD